MLYILEHLELRLYKWCYLEYQHISKIVGKEHLLFTNIKTASQKNKLLPFGKVEQRSVTELNLQRACILDPFAQKTLKPEDKHLFDYFIFGGILGDYPMKARTKVELSNKLNAQIRNIGKEQFPTDNAFYVVKQIIENNKQLSDLKFKDELELPIKEGESVHLPFRYVLIKGKPLVYPKLMHYLKTKKGF